MKFTKRLVAFLMATIMAVAVLPVAVMANPANVDHLQPTRETINRVGFDGEVLDVTPTVAAGALSTAMPAGDFIGAFSGFTGSFGAVATISFPGYTFEPGDELHIAGRLAAAPGATLDGYVNIGTTQIISNINWLDSNFENQTFNTSIPLTGTGNLNFHINFWTNTGLGSLILAVDDILIYRPAGGFVQPDFMYDILTDSIIQGADAGHIIPNGGNLPDTIRGHYDVTSVTVRTSTCDRNYLFFSNLIEGWGGVHLPSNVVANSTYRITGRTGAGWSTGQISLTAGGNQLTPVVNSGTLDGPGQHFIIEATLDAAIGNLRLTAPAGSSFYIYTVQIGAGVYADFTPDEWYPPTANFSLVANGVPGEVSTSEIEIRLSRELGQGLALANITLDAAGTGAQPVALRNVSPTLYVLDIEGVTGYGRVSITIDHSYVTGATMTVFIHYEGEAIDFTRGPNVFADADSPTGYSVQFVLHRPGATSVNLVGTFYLRPHTGGTNVSPRNFVQGHVPIGAHAQEYSTAMSYYGNGYWAVTLPLPGGTYSYWFTGSNIPGRIFDPANPPYRPAGHSAMDTGYVGSRHSSVAVPWCEVNQHERNNRNMELPRENPDERGTVVSSRFTSSIASVGGFLLDYGIAGDMFGYLLVYLPPGHDPYRAEPYPVIYMSHGINNDATSWMNGAGIPYIMDNLIALDYIEPTIVVSINNTRHGGNFNGGTAGVNARNDLINHIMPHVEARYNASSSPYQRAIGGYSLGTSWAVNVYINAPAHFRHYGFFCPAVPTPGLANVPARYRDSSVHVMGHGSFNNHGQVEVLLANTTNNSEHIAYGTHCRHTWAQLFTTWARDYLWDLPQQAYLWQAVSTVEDRFGPDSAPMLNTVTNADILAYINEYLSQQNLGRQLSPQIAARSVDLVHTPSISRVGTVELYVVGTDYTATANIHINLSYFGPNPPTGVADIALAMFGMFALLAVSVALWGFVLRRRFFVGKNI